MHAPREQHSARVGPPALNDYHTIDAVRGPLVILNRVKNPQFSEIVTITLGDGTKRRGQVLKCDGKKV